MPQGSEQQETGEGQWEDGMGMGEVSEQTLAPNITDPNTLQVMKGSFHNTPLLPTNTVRIFLSSTFSGTALFLFS